MKIAVPTREGHIDHHFGHCDHFTIFTVDGKTIVAEDTMASPEGCGCKSNVAVTMAQDGVCVLIGGNMGEGAKNVLNANGIKVIRGQEGDVRTAVERYLRGELEDHPQGCTDHNCGHRHH